MRLNGKKALVVGGASGIGAAISRRFAQEGAAVVIADRDSEAGEAEAKRLLTEGSRAWFVACDVTNEDEVKAAVASAIGWLDAIDVSVSCAGITGERPAFLESTTEDFERVQRVNLTGSYMLGREVARHMVTRGNGGAIIHVSSVGAVLGVPETFAYCASKAALGMLTKTMALSLAEHGIRVNAVAPGPTESPMMVNLPEAMRQTMLSRTPLRRFAEPDEIAATALFLASDDASYLTGQTIYVDGGRLALNYVVDPPASAQRRS